MPFIRNAAELLEHGRVEAREVLLDIAEHALRGADPYRATRATVTLEADVLRVGELRFRLPEVGAIYVLGAGKASFPIARALEDILGDRIADGVLICKYGQTGELDRVRLRLAGHPIPDEAGLAAAREVAALARATRPGDLVFCCITGGSSALMPMPVPGITLEEKREVNRLLLHSGANIIEINSVRKHLSRIKGGRLAAMTHPQATIINLTVSDVIGDPLDYITCPTVPDTSTFADARATLTKYRLWDRVPASVRTYLTQATDAEESPKDLSDHQIHDFIIVPGVAACEAALSRAKELGYGAFILSTMLEGESREVGATFAAVAREIVAFRRPLVPPCVVVGGGETTVRITGEPGNGGPSQEFAAGAAPWLDGAGKVALLAMDTDGTDGPTEVAGAIVDDQTMARARALGQDVFAALEKHDTGSFFRTLGDTVVTGATGTNVNDLRLLAVL